MLFLLVPLGAALVWASLSGAGHRPVAGGITYQHTREQLVVMYPGYFFFKGPREAKKVALTFDDGPDAEVTPRILDILKENRVRATFFVVGQNIRRHPGMVRRIAAEGHTIGNHTWTHLNMTKLGQEQVRQEIEKTADLIESLTGHRSVLIRVPWGAVSDTVMRVAQKEGLRVIGWSVDSFDWRDKVPARVLTNLETQVHPGAIVLMHAVAFPGTGEVTPRVLPLLIRNLEKRGYQFVTVDELLGLPPYHTAQAPCSFSHNRNFGPATVFSCRQAEDLRLTHRAVRE